MRIRKGFEYDSHACALTTELELCVNKLAQHKHTNQWKTTHSALSKVQYLFEKDIVFV